MGLSCNMVGLGTVNMKKGRTCDSDTIQRNKNIYHSEHAYYK